MKNIINVLYIYDEMSILIIDLQDVLMAHMVLTVCLDVDIVVIMPHATGSEESAPVDVLWVIILISVTRVNITINKDCSIFLNFMS